MVRNAAILILDEPTTGLDAESERVVLDALDRVMAGKTTVVIAHKLSTVRRADLIVVIEGGRTVERGTHDELLGRGGRHAQLYRLSQALPAGPEAAGRYERACWAGGSVGAAQGPEAGQRKKGTRAGSAADEEEMREMSTPEQPSIVFQERDTLPPETVEAL